MHGSVVGIVPVPPVLVLPAIGVEPPSPSPVPPEVVGEPPVLVSAVPEVLPVFILPVPALLELLPPEVLPMRGVLLAGSAPHAPTAAERPTRNPIIVRDDISFSPVRHAGVPLPKNAGVPAEPRATRTTARNFRQFRASIRAAAATFERALQPSRVRRRVS